MEPSEVRALRREILDDLAPILREELAASEWGRLLVGVVRGPEGAPVVAEIDVDELVGDEAKVEAIFNGEAIRAVLPVLAKAVEALCALDDLDLDDVRGGTFVRMPDGRFGWLPSLVRAPSATLDAERDDLVSRLRASNDRFHARFGRPANDRLGIDLAIETVTWRVAGRVPLRARATLIGTFAPRSRTWGWGSSNPHAPPAVRASSAALVDDIVERDAWELSTPVFPTDELTAWAIAAFILNRAMGEAVVCVPDEEGLVFVLIRDVRVDVGPSRPPLAR
ncbi:MAG TPA: hypothetical protein VHV30_14560 [Polyangiaceae bacterium]|jgi:hypothetical protein|nr:hypothetical protein [Polyangiaceae bacterium]